MARKKPPKKGHEILADSVRQFGISMKDAGLAFEEASALLQGLVSSVGNLKVGRFFVARRNRNEKRPD